MEREYRRPSATRYGSVANAALKPMPYDEPSYSPAPRKRKVAAAPQKKPIKVFGIIMKMMVVSALLCLVLARYAMICENNIQVQKVKQDIVENHDKVAHLEIKLASAMDLNKMEQTARTQLGMDYPSPDQTVSVTLDTVKAASVQDESPKNWFDSLLDCANALERRLMR